MTYTKSSVEDYVDDRIDIAPLSNVFLDNAGNQTLTGDRNFAVGTNAGLALTSGGDNFFMGRDAGANTTESFYSIAIGDRACRYMGGGAGRHGNIGIGLHACMGSAVPANNTGIYNTAIQSSALISVTSASYSVAIGFQAGQSITTGGSNVFLGYQAGKSVTDGSANFALGSGAFENGGSTNNVAIGSSAMAGDAGGISGTSNVAICANSLAALSSGAVNVAISLGAGTLITTGGHNVLIGRDAGSDLTTEDDNTALGRTAMGETAVGAGSTAIGGYAGAKAGAKSVCLGWGAGYYETGSAKLFIDNALRTNEADGRIKAMVYGEFHATRASQNIFLNCTVGTAETFTANYDNVDADFIINKNTTGVALNYNAGTDLWTLGANLTLDDAIDIAFNTTTGTKIGTATTQKLAFYGATPIVQPTEITDELTTVTFTAPGTPDYAIQDLTTTSPYGFVTADEGQTVLSVIANNQIRINALEDALSSLGLLADAD